METADKKEEFWHRSILFLVAVAILAKFLFRPDDVPDLRVVIVFIEIFICLSILPFVIKNKSLSFEFSPYSLVLGGGWFILTSLSVFYSDYFYPALLRQAEIISLLCLGFCLAIYAARNKKFLEDAAKVVIVAFSITAFIELSKWFSLEDPHKFDWLGFNVLQNYIHIRHFGDLASLSALLSIYFIFHSDKRERLLGMASFLVAMTAVFFSGGRATILIVLMCVFAISFLKKNYYILGLVIVSLVLSSAIIPQNNKAGIIRFFLTSSESGELGDQPTINTSTSGRSHIWSVSYASSLTKPLLGFGPDTYKYMQPHLYGQTPHNTFLQFALDWGWPATIIASVFLFYLLYISVLEVWRLRSGSASINQFWCAGYVAFFLHGLVATTFYEPVDLLMVALMSAAILLSKPDGLRGRSIGFDRRICSGLVVSLLIPVLIINFSALHSLSILKKMRRGQEVTQGQLEYYMEYPYSANGFINWLGTLRNVDVDKLIGFVEWGEKNAEYMSWLYSAHLSRLYRGAGDEAMAKGAFIRSLEKAGSSLHPQVLMVSGFSREEYDSVLKEVRADAVYY
jgi:O-antigen ligase